MNKEQTLKKSMIIGTAYLPPIEYMAVLTQFKTVFIEQFETFPRQTYRNRCYIYSPNGVLPLIIPVAKNEIHNCKTKDIGISCHENWPINHWRAIKTAYNNSPFFLFYKDEFETFYNTHYQNLLEFNTLLLKKILEFIGIPIQIQFTSAFIKHYENVIDLRNTIHPKKEDLVENASFPGYFQVFSDKMGFQPNLSIIDLLFNMGPESGAYLREMGDILLKPFH